LFKNLLKKAKKAVSSAVEKVKSGVKKVTGTVKKAVQAAKSPAVKKAVTSTVLKVPTKPQPKPQPTTKQVTTAAAKAALDKLVDIISRPSSALLSAAKHSAEMEKEKPGSSWSLAGLKGGAQAFMRGLTGKEKTTGQEYLATKGMKPGNIRSVVGTALDIATTPGAGNLARTGAAAARAGASRLLPRVGSAAGAVGARTGATAAARAGTAGRAALPAATETAQAARVAVQPTALVPRGTSAIAPAAQRAASAGAGAGVGAGAAAGTTQAARAAAAGLRSLGARVASAGAGVAQRLGAGAAKVGSGLRTAGQFARRNLGKAAALGLAGGLAYSMFAPGKEEVPETMEPETPDQQITVPSDSYITGGYRGGGIGSMTGYGVGGIGSMTGYGVGGMSEGAGMPGLQEMKDELFSLIDSSVGQNSVMTVSWMNQLLDSINQMEQQLIEQYRQQGSELDPATKAALDELRRDVELRRQTLMEELNRRGLLQSGIWLEEENRLNQGLLTARNSFYPEDCPTFKTALMRPYGALHSRE